jgi:hypothetical protein
MGVLNILHGDRQESYGWGPDSAAQISSARQRFDEYRKQGFLACKISGSDRGGVVVGEFDPEAAEIFMIDFVDGG